MCWCALVCVLDFTTCGRLGVYREGSGSEARGEGEGARACARETGLFSHRCVPLLLQYPRVVVGKARGAGERGRNEGNGVAFVQHLLTRLLPPPSPHPTHPLQALPHCHTMSSNLYATPEQDKEHADHKFGANDAVPTQQRHCTDVFFLCVLFAFWGGVAAMIAMSVNSAGGLLGINRVLHGTQIDGKVCALWCCGAVRALSRVLCAYCMLILVQVLTLRLYLSPFSTRSAAWRSRTDRVWRTTSCGTTTSSSSQ